jgi:hypothetical protein
MGRILQQLGSQGFSNKLFMVDVEEVEETRMM